jgi:hypothetical protein
LACGASLQSGDVFCGECGESVTASSRRRAAPHRPTEHEHAAVSAPTGAIAARPQPTIGPSATAPLPTMVTVIRIYVFFVFPILYLLSLSLAWYFYLFPWDEALGLLERLLDGVDVFVTAVIYVILFTGARRIRTMRRSGASLLQLGLMLNLAWCACYIIACIGFGVAAAEMGYGPKDDAGIVLEITFGCFELLALVFEIVAVIWLFLNKASSPLSHD